MITRDMSRAAPRQQFEYFSRGTRVSSRVNQYRRACLTLRHGRRRERLAFVGRERPAAADLADDACLDAGAVDAFRQVGSNLKREILDAPLIHALGMDRVHIEAGAHDDVHSRFAGDSGQHGGVAPDGRRGRIDDRAASDVPVHPDFPDGGVQFHQVKIGMVAVVVAPYPSQVLQRYGSILQFPGWRVLGRAKQERDVDIEVLMSRGGTELRWWHGTQHGLDETLILSSWHGVDPRSSVFRKSNMTRSAAQRGAGRPPRRARGACRASIRGSSAGATARTASGQR